MAYFTLQLEQHVSFWSKFQPLKVIFSTKFYVNSQESMPLDLGNVIKQRVYHFILQLLEEKNLFYQTNDWYLTHNDPVDQTAFSLLQDLHFNHRFTVNLTD